MPTNIKKGNYESEVHNRNKLFYFIYVHHTNILSCMVIEPTTYSAEDRAVIKAKQCLIFRIKS